MQNFFCDVEFIFLKWIPDNKGTFLKANMLTSFSVKWFNFTKICI